MDKINIYHIVGNGQIWAVGLYTIHFDGCRLTGIDRLLNHNTQNKRRVII